MSTKYSDPDETSLWLSIKLNSRIAESYNYDHSKIYAIISGKTVELLIKVKLCSIKIIIYNYIIALC